MDPDSINLSELVVVLALAVAIPLLSLYVVKRLRLNNKILEWTLAMGLAGLVVGLKAPYVSFILQMTVYGLVLGLVIGILVWGLDRLRSRKGEVSSR